MSSILRVAASVLAAIAAVVFVTRIQVAAGDDPVLSFVFHGHYAQAILGAIFGVGIWALLGELE